MITAAEMIWDREGYADPAQAARLYLEKGWPHPKDISPEAAEAKVKLASVNRWMERSAIRDPNFSPAEDDTRLKVESYASEPRLHRDEFYRWAAAMHRVEGWPLPKGAPSRASVAARRWPEFSCYSNMQLLSEAWDTFWSSHDPSRPPKSDVIVDWLKSERGATDNIARAIDAVMRSDAARAGGNKVPTQKAP